MSFGEQLKKLRVAAHRKGAQRKPTGTRTGPRLHSMNTTDPTLARRIELRRLTREVPNTRRDRRSSAFARNAENFPAGLRFRVTVWPDDVGNRVVMRRSVDLYELPFNTIENPALIDAMIAASEPHAPEDVHAALALADVSSAYGHRSRKVLDLFVKRGIVTLEQIRAAAEDPEIESIP